MPNQNDEIVGKQFSASDSNKISLTECFNIHDEIGRGRFAKVCKLSCKETGELFAAKMIRRRRLGKDTITAIQKEIDILTTATERGVDSIVSLKDVFSTPSEVTLVLNYAAGGELYRLVCIDGPLPEHFVRSVVLQLLHSIRFLHANGIVHLDIKPDNILLKEPYPSSKVLLCDFGLAKYLNDGKEHRDLVGTPDYVAPEILDYDPITIQADMWSVGVVTFYLLTGISPFIGDSKEETLCKITMVNIDYSDLEEEHSEEVRAFMAALIRRHAKDRLTADEALNHKWLTAGDFSNGISHLSPVASTCSPIACSSLSGTSISSKSPSAISCGAVESS